MYIFSQDFHVPDECFPHQCQRKEKIINLIVHSTHYSTKKVEKVQKRSQLSLVSTVSKVINEYEEEGLRMADLECMVK